MPEGYTVEERPGHEGTPLVVNISIAVIRLHSISETAMVVLLSCSFATVLSDIWPV